MRELHVVAVSEDGRHVVLATRKGAAARPEYRVVMDDRLKAAIRGDLPRLGEHAAPESAVTPKEIQARLRAGETVEQIAASAGVPDARVERFAGPVLSERERMVAGARSAVLARPRRGPSRLSLGDAVAEHLQDMAGYKPDSTTWSARREESGRWLVQVSFVSRAKQRTAGWRYDPATREVTAVDAWSAAIAHVDAPATTRESTPAARARRQADAAPVSGRSIAASPPPELPGTVGNRSAAARSAAARPAAGRAAAATATTRSRAATPGPGRSAAPRPAAARSKAATSGSAAPAVAVRTPGVAVSRAAAARPQAALTTPSNARATVAASTKAAAPAKAKAAAPAKAKATAPARTTAVVVGTKAAAAPAKAKATAPVRAAAVSAGTKAKAPAPAKVKASGTAPAPVRATARSVSAKAAAAPAKARAAVAPAMAGVAAAPAGASAKTGTPAKVVTHKAPAARRAPAKKSFPEAVPAAVPDAPRTPPVETVGPETAGPQAPAPEPAAAALAPNGPPTLRVVPPHEPEPTAATPPEQDVIAAPRPVARRAAGGRATVPDWADVLMGAAPVRPSGGAKPDPSSD